MGSLGDRFAKYDDKPIYRASDPTQKVHWRRGMWPLILAEVTSAIFLAVMATVIGTLTASLVLFALAIAFLVAYVVKSQRVVYELSGSDGSRINLS